jgi:hypothetical protein
VAIADGSMAEDNTDDAIHGSARSVASIEDIFEKSRLKTTYIRTRSVLSQIDAIGTGSDGAREEVKTHRVDDVLHEAGTGSVGAQGSADVCIGPRRRKRNLELEWILRKRQYCHRQRELR